MRRPVVGLCLSFGGGVGLGLYVGPEYPGLHQGALLVAVVGLAAVAGLLVLNDRLGVVGVYGIAALLGLVLSTFPAADPEGSLFELNGGQMTCTVDGVVYRDVIDHTDVTDGSRRLQFVFRRSEIWVNGRSQPLSAPLQVTLYGVPLKLPLDGEHWILDGTLYKKVFKGEEQWQFYTGVDSARRVDLSGFSLSAMLQQARCSASVILTYGIDSMADVSGVINALLLGYRYQLPADVKRSFVSTGTMHIFAISGLHVAILCSVLVFAIGLCRVPRTCRVFWLVPMIALYVVTTGGRASAMRAGIMASAYLLAPALGRRPDVLSAMALAGIMILIWQPLQLVDPGCIFSFAVVCGILAFVPVFDAVLKQWLQPDPFILPELAEDSHPWWHAPALWIGQLASVSLAAWLTSLPLSLYFFGQFSPIALIANLIVVPLAFLIMVTGCLSLVSGIMAGLWLAGIFNSANAVFVRLLMGAMRLLEAVPYGHASGVNMPGIGLVTYYCLLGYGAVVLRNMMYRPQNADRSELDP